MSAHDQIASPSAAKLAWAREWEFHAVIVLAIGIYFWRMTLLPACGEETRVAHMAVQMIETGDWVVPRQQGVPFPERPPLGAWLMALVGLARGKVDLVAMRLPSALSILLTALLVYGYARGFLSRLGAFASAIAFLTAAQVMQIGRHGESEPLFTLLVSGSLLFWHYGMTRHWPLAGCWVAGYSLAALGALVKGPQAPIYFAVSAGAYLILKRDWRRLVCWQHLLGLAAFVGIVALWLVPFASQMGMEATADIWTILARKRFGTGGLTRHLIAYPVEIFICLLSWSPLAFHLLGKRFRASLVEHQPYVTFLATAVVMTFPSVWLAAGARGRYYMPLYPVLALLLGIVVQRSALDMAGTFAERGWRRFLVCMAALAVAAGIALVGLNCFAEGMLVVAVQPLGWTLAYWLLAVSGATALWWAKHDARRASLAVAVVAALLGFIYTGLVLNQKANSANDIAPAVASVRRRLPDGTNLVSLGPIAHQFAFAYREAIPELPWPSLGKSLDPGVEYFCFNISERDRPGGKRVGRGMKFVEVSDELPFAWEEIARLNYGRQRDSQGMEVVVGRVISRTAKNMKHAPQ